MATTTNFGWTTPDNTALVKDGAAAIRSLGSAIDTSMGDLRGGTTGQVLTKATNTDMDFTWTAVDPLVILDAKGDLISATAADTPARLAVGTNGQVLTADSTTSTGLKWATPSTGGGMTLISTTTANNDATVVISSIPTTYKNLQLVIRNLRGSVDNQDVRMRINGDTGSVYREMTGNDGGQAFNATFLTIGNGSDTATSQGLCFVNIVDYANTATWKIAQATYVNNNGDITTSLQFKNSPGLLTNLTAAVTSLTIYMASGNVTAGTFLLYGVS